MIQQFSVEWDSFSVEWDSPSQGLMRIVWDEDLVVRGGIVPIHDYLRVDNLWIRMERGAAASVMTAWPFKVHHGGEGPNRVVSFDP